jgi:hypothetical protein
MCIQDITIRNLEISKLPVKARALAPRARTKAQPTLRQYTLLRRSFCVKTGRKRADSRRRWGEPAPAFVWIDPVQKGYFAQDRCLIVCRETQAW